MKIKLKWGIDVIIITSLSIILLFGIYFYVIKGIISSENLNMKEISGAILVTILFSFCYLNAPLYIYLTDKQFVVKKIYGNITISYNDIKLLAPSSFSLLDIRFFGTAGVGGFLGFYSNADIGRFFSYVVNRENTFLLVKKNGRKYIFSCQEYDKIADFIREKLTIKS